MASATMVHPEDGARMGMIPAGTFLMGVRDDTLMAKEHEKPQREVWLSAYWIDLYPVTNEQYARFIDSGGYENTAYWTPEGWDWRQQRKIQAPLMWCQSNWDAADQPVAGVSWFEATAYARWAGKRLPTEAQWEKAARGSDGRRYPWGENWPTSELANFNNTVGHTTAVGSYPKGASPYGCYDMAGNVNNWCDDWYWPGFYRLCAELGMNRNPHLHDLVRSQLAEPLAQRIDRGGGFATPLVHHEVLSCTDKVHWPPENHDPWNGFRTATEADQSESLGFEIEGPGLESI